MLGRAQVAKLNGEVEAIVLCCRSLILEAGKFANGGVFYPEIGEPYESNADLRTEYIKWGFFSI
jgi:hypothetical protein